MKKRNGISAILFDIDDTLFDRKKAIEEVLKSIVMKLSNLFQDIPLSKVIENFREADRMALEEFNKGHSGIEVRDKRSRWFLKKLGLNERFSSTVTKLYIDAYPDVSASVKDSKMVVERLSKEFALGIISNGFPDVQYNKLRALNIEKMFKAILLSEEIGIRKPDVRIFQRAAELLGNETKDCLFVGDSFEIDIVGAKRSGMKACWFNRDGIQRKNEEIKPDFEIYSLPELLHL